MLKGKERKRGEKRDKARDGRNGEGQGLPHRMMQMILLLVRCSVIHFCCCSLISSSPIYMSKVPVEPWNTHTPTHTHTPTLVILGQPLCSFSQSSGCPSSPITVATELHPDSLQIGYVTLNAGAPTHFTHTHTPTQHVHATHCYKHIFKDHKNTLKRTHTST